MADRIRENVIALLAQRSTSSLSDNVVPDVTSCVLRAIGDDARFEIDSSGIVYEHSDEGMFVLGACTQIKGPCAIRDGAVSIEERAFMRQNLIDCVTMPHGITSIGKRAFFECERLSKLAIPPSVREIGDEAFCYTNLQEIRLPDCLSSIGLFAFSKRGGNDPSSIGHAHGNTVLSATRGRGAELLITELPDHDDDNGHIRIPPRYEVGSACRRFAVINGFLCSKNPDGSTFTALSYSEKSRMVTVDRRVNAIAAYALEGAEDVRELVVHLGIERIGKQGLTLPYPLECLAVDELDGNMTRLYPSDDLAGKIAQSSCFTSEGIDLPQLADNCDLTLSRMLHGYERLRRIIARLENGRYLSNDLRDMFEHVASAYFEKNIRMFAAHDDAPSVRRLVKLGVIDASNIARAIEIASDARSTTVTRCLLEERRLHFSGRLLDLEL